VLQALLLAVMMATSGWDLPDRYGLTLNGEPFYSSCAPLAVEAVTSHWGRPVPAQGLIDAHAAQWGAGGVGIHQFEQDLEDAGYRYQSYVDSDFDTLRDAVWRAPVIAHVKWGWGQSGQPHAVIVYGMDEHSAHIADPGTATTYDVPINEFRQSWGSDSGGQHRVFHTIEPKEKETATEPPPEWEPKAWPRPRPRRR